MIVEQIQKLCKQNNITIAKLERDLNFGNGTIRRWDSNPPSVLRLLEVAKYFNVTIDDLIKQD